MRTRFDDFAAKARPSAAAVGLIRHRRRGDDARWPPGISARRRFRQMLLRDTAIIVDY